MKKQGFPEETVAREGKFRSRAAFWIFRTMCGSIRRERTITNVSKSKKLSKELTAYYHLKRHGPHRKRRLKLLQVQLCAVTMFIQCGTDGEMRTGTGIRRTWEKNPVPGVNLL
jgi:hypothetical protein